MGEASDGFERTSRRPVLPGRRFLLLAVSGSAPHLLQLALLPAASFSPLLVRCRRSSCTAYRPPSLLHCIWDMWLSGSSVQNLIAGPAALVHARSTSCRSSAGFPVERRTRRRHCTGLVWELLSLCWLHGLRRRN